ncbi:hypothetical protein AURDEDRAFT_155893 [Auricularia subglabra TFB-10046 SS5]|nr:hypothetical protein AURDEDRAFT_155893 [Auricularia subglabra TFB-10046 SS5]
MPSLSHQQRQSIQDFIKGVLKASLDGNPHAQTHLEENDDDPVVALASAVRSAATEAIASFLEAHNDKPSNLLVRLPPELAQACFRLLGFRGRVAVSHVSRAWRRIALADCGLWNALTFKKTPPVNCAIEMLETLLARSGDMPFELAWALPSRNSIPDALLAVIIDNMARMGALTLYDCARFTNARVVKRKAPNLRRLVSEDDGMAVLPADWGTRWVPRLELLMLHTFAIPEGFEPLAELRSLHGRLAPQSSIPVLSHVFPRLNCLDLQDITQKALQNLGAPPPSCKKVWLGGPYGDTVDYSPFLQACYDRPIPFLAVSRARSVYPSVLEFVNATRGPCSMIIWTENELWLRCDHDKITRELSAELPIVDERNCFSYLDRLTELSLPLEILLGLRELQSEGVTPFPSVRTLTIRLTSDSLPPRLRHLLYQGADDAPLQMPRLEDLMLDALVLHFMDHVESDSGRADMRWIVHGLPGVLPAILRMERPRLETLEVTMSEYETEQFTSRLDLTALRGLARVLRVQDEDSCFVREYVDA